MERECKRCAQPAWKAYESAVATLPGVPPTSQGLARSLLWLRMAEGADRAERGTSDPWHDEGHLLSRRECCRRAVAAAPDHRAAHDALLDCLKQEGRSDELSTAAAAAVERFPDHEQALCVLADGAHRTGRPLEAVELQERALRCRPHDASMRRALLAYRCALARQMAARGDHAGARALLDEPFLTAACGPDRQAALCLRASIEYLAGDSSAAEEWLERACRTEPGRPSALLSARIEAAALSLSPRIARKLKSSYSVALREPATGAVAVALLRVLAAAPNGLEEEWIRAERKAVLRYMKRASPETFGASELGEACALLEQGGEKRHVRSLAASGQRRYPDDPVFPLVLASYLAANEPDAGSLGRARVLLAQADRLARRSAAHAHLLGAIARLQNRVNDALAVSQLRSIFHIVEGFPFGFETRRPNAPRPAPGSRRRAPARQGRDDRQRSFFDVL
jgi:tetratricopeptide (TPR) repeat protein